MNWLRGLAAVVLGFVALSCASPARAQVDALPYVTSITTEPSPPCPDSSYQLVVRGVFPTSCGRVIGARVAGPEVVELRVQTPYPAAAFCLPDSVPWEHRFPMPGLDAGLHVMTLVMVEVDSTLPTKPPVTHVAEFPLTVAAVCDSVPRPSPLSFLGQLAIYAVGPDDRPKPWICPSDPIVVSAAGRFPNDCYVLRKIELVPSPIMAPFPVPPIVRFVFDDRACLDRACAEVATPWRGRVAMPPLPQGNYHLIVEAAIVTCRDSVLPGDPLESTTFAFRVARADSCGPDSSAACLWPSWDHSGNVGGCDALIDAEGRASVTMNLMTTVPLAGVEGWLHVSPPNLGLGIGAVEPIGPAAGMVIQTTPTADGVRFVMFATAGAPIPASDSMSGVPVLKVSLVPLPLPADARIAPPERWTVAAGPVFGADANAALVPLCPIRTLDGASLVAEVATVCRRRSCDFNHDGREDIRDLVGLVRCLNGLPPCDGGAAAGVDCQGDGDFDLDDVVCCAHSVLGREPCLACTGDSTRTAPRVSLAFGEPVATAAGLRVPLRVNGIGELGGARFALDYPQAGWRIAGFETAGVPSSWLALHAPSGDDLGVALLRVGQEATLSIEDAIELTLLLEPIEGANGAGEVRVTDAEFSGVDGVRLAVSAAAPALPIGDPAALALSPATPNPFDASTTFRLALGSRAKVAVGVYDLAGRRVASLHDGVLPVGVHPFTWNGRRDDGSRAAGGVYFYRAESGGRVTARKMVLLGTR